MERKESKIFLPSDEQSGQLIDAAWKDFYEKAAAAGLGIDDSGVRCIVKDFFVSGYAYGYNDVLNIIRDQMAAEELAKGVQGMENCPGKDAKLYTLGFSVRVLNCLKSADIETLGDLLRVCKSGIFRIPQLGKKSLREIEDFYERYGFSWGSEMLEYRSDRPYLGSGCYYLPKKGERV